MPAFGAAHLAGKGCWASGVRGGHAGPDCLAPCRDGLPYCEADYHAKFGIRCDGCQKYITGHVLEVSGAGGACERHGPSERSPAPGGCCCPIAHPLNCEDRKGPDAPVCLCEIPPQSLHCPRPPGSARGHLPGSGCHLLQESLPVTPPCLSQVGGALRVGRTCVGSLVQPLPLDGEPQAWRTCSEPSGQACVLTGGSGGSPGRPGQTVHMKWGSAGC